MTRKYGTHRTVYLIGSWAIKRPVFVEWRLFLYGLLANMQETSFGKTGWPELCPVIFGCPGGFFLIMRRAVPVTTEAFFAKFPTDLAFETWRETPDYVVPVEFKPDSFGMIEGRLVAIDFG